LQEYTASLAYCQKALAYTNDPDLLQYIFTNQGNAYQKLKKYDEAISSYRQVIRLSDKKGTNYARALTNLATTKWLKDRNYNAAHDLHTALAIRLKGNDIWGQNSSYAHLSDFYAALHPDSALYYAKKMLIVARGLQSADDELEALQKLARLADFAAVRSYFLRYQMVSDSLTAARRAAKNQFAVIRYGVEKSKADNLRLQKDNAEKRFQLGGVLAVMAVGAAAAIFWHRKRGEHLKLENEREVRETKLRLSRKVHDVVANGIYRVMNEVEHGEKLDRAHLLNQLEAMYEQSRDITYENEVPLPDDFAQDITRLLNAFKSTAIKLAVTGNEPFVWNAVNTTIKCELQPVLQELMVNMTKHSQASQARVSFEIKAGTLFVAYRDNGVGLSPDINFGNGLRNTGNRIESLGGKLTFATDAGDGARIQLIIPIT
jgi:tetratricopeptide (TPR) repeat protein